MLRSIVLLFVLCFCVNLLLAQDATKHKMIGFNMTEMVSQFVPFHEKITLTGPYQFTWRAGKNGKMFNFQLGHRKVKDEFIFIDPFIEPIRNNRNFTNIALGFSRIKDFSDKFYWISSQSLMYSSGSYNTRDMSNNLFFRNDSSYGLELAWGAGYRLGKRISIFAETRIIISRKESVDFIALDVLPPIGLFLVADLN